MQFILNHRGNIYSVVVGFVNADILAPRGANTSADTVMTKFKYDNYTALAY